MEPWNPSGYVPSNYSSTGDYVGGGYNGNDGWGYGGYGTGGTGGYQTQSVPQGPPGPVPQSAPCGYVTAGSAHGGYSTDGYGSGHLQGGYTSPSYPSGEGYGGEGDYANSSGVYQSQVPPEPPVSLSSHGSQGGHDQLLQVKEESKPVGAKGKKINRKKEPSKKSASAYAHFFRDIQARIKEVNKTVSFGDISKIVASEWDALSIEEKAVYKRKAENAKNDQFRDIALSHAMAVAGGQVSNFNVENNS